MKKFIIAGLLALSFGVSAKPIDVYYCAEATVLVDNGEKVEGITYTDRDLTYDGTIVVVNYDRSGFRFKADVFSNGQARKVEGLKRMGSEYVSRDNDSIGLEYDDRGRLEFIRYSERDGKYTDSIILSKCKRS
ncbi:hypothetical protein YJ57_20305 [Salmonella enterica subsp. enterica]|nr:hypothetical protein [Salmonella enterica subsp. enterica]EDV1533704.1 hypothetical protein [Salmonella enterica subsp. enterica]